MSVFFWFSLPLSPIPPFGTSPEFSHEKSFAWHLKNRKNLERNATRVELTQRISNKTLARHNLKSSHVHQCEFSAFSSKPEPFIFSYHMCWVPLHDSYNFSDSYDDDDVEGAHFTASIWSDLYAIDARTRQLKEKKVEWRKSLLNDIRMFIAHRSMSWIFHTHISGGSGATSHIVRESEASIIKYLFYAYVHFLEWWPVSQSIYSLSVSYVAVDVQVHFTCLLCFLSCAVHVWNCWFSLQIHAYDFGKWKEHRRHWIFHALRTAELDCWGSDWTKIALLTWSKVWVEREDIRVIVGHTCIRPDR